MTRKEIVIFKGDRPRRIAIFGKPLEAQDIGDGPKSMARQLAAHAEDEQYEAYTYNDLRFRLQQNDARVFVATDSGLEDIAHFSAILCIEWFKGSRYFEDTVFALANYAKAHGVPCLNEETMSRSKSKLSQYLLFAQAGLPFPRTLFQHEPKRLIEEATQEFGYPFVLKTTTGSRGANNFLVRNDEDAVSGLQQAVASGRPFCAQEYIANDGDFRILVMHGRIGAVIHRQNQTEGHLNNTSAGGKATLVSSDSLAPEVQRMALDAAALLRRDIGGVDVMLDSRDQSPYLLEVNNMPQLSTGTFVNEKMAALAAMFRSIT